MIGTTTWPGPRRVKVESYGERQQMWVPTDRDLINDLLRRIHRVTGVERYLSDFTDPDYDEFMPDDLGSFLITAWNYLLFKHMGAGSINEDELDLLTNYLDALVGETDGEMDP